MPKIKDNTLAKADSMAPAMLRRYKNPSISESPEARGRGQKDVSYEKTMTLKNPPNFLPGLCSS